MPEAILDGKTGLLFTPGDADGLKECILRMDDGACRIISFVSAVKSVFMILMPNFRCCLISWLNKRKVLIYSPSEQEGIS